MKNPELFDICATYLLADLYEKFPVPAQIEYDPLYFKISEKFQDATEDDLIHIYRIIESSLRWLERSGFLYLGHIDKLVAGDVILTEKGLKTLRSVPHSVDVQRETVGDLLAQAGKEGTKDAVIRGIGALFSIMLVAV